MCQNVCTKSMHDEKMLTRVIKLVIPAYAVGNCVEQCALN